MSFHVKWSFLLRVSALKTILWLQFHGFWSSKKEGRKGVKKKWARKWNIFLRCILLEVTWLFGMTCCVFRLCQCGHIWHGIQQSTSQRLEALQHHYRSRSQQQQYIPYLTIFKKCFPQCFNVFLIFFVNMTVFPAVHAGTRTAVYYLTKDSFITQDRNGQDEATFQKGPCINNVNT